MKYPLCFVVSYFNPLHSISNQELFEKHLCNQSIQSLSTMKNTISIAKGNHHMLPPNQHFSLSAKMNGTQRRILVSMHCMYCGMPKGTSRDETALNSEKIMSYEKIIFLVIIELRLSEDISYSVSQSVSRKFHIIFFEIP